MNVNPQNGGKANIYCRLYIPFVNPDSKYFENNKSAKINDSNIPRNIFYRKAVFLIGMPKLNVGYFFHIILILTCQLKFIDKNGDMKQNVGYVYFIEEY